MRLRELLIVLATIGLGLFFLIAGAGKLLMGYDNFSPVVPLTFMPSAVTGFIYFIVPFAEVLIGLLLVLSVGVRFVAAVSSVLVAGFVASNLYMISMGIEECNTCFGVFGSLSPYSTLILDGVIAALIIIVVFYHPGDFFNLTPWYLSPVHKPDGEPSLVSHQGL